MDLSPYLEGLRRDLAASAAPAGEAVARSAELLAGALEASARLYLLEALSDAAAEITTKLDGGTVEVRLRGRDAELVVSDAHPDHTPAGPPPATADTGDVARMTLRLPEPLKVQVERAASDDGVSVNAWLVRAVAGALRTAQAGWPGSGAGAAPPGRVRNRMTGYAQT